jgi:hypothetical protein
VEAVRAAHSGRAFWGGEDPGRQREGHPGPCWWTSARSRSTKIASLNQIRDLGFTGPIALRPRLGEMWR